MHQSDTLKHHLLIAMPNMRNQHFARTVTYLCEHTPKGAMGIVINRPTSLKLADIFNQMDITSESPRAANTRIFDGGPVEEQRGFVLHQHDRLWDSTLRITEHISLTASRDVLEAVARDEGPDKSLMALGYAGWGAGKLEQEMLDNAWLLCPADNAILFDTPVEKRWQAAAQRIGVDLNLLSLESGHA
jgi:putative transcriptional regulator